MSFSPALGITVEYKGSVGEIKFIDETFEPKLVDGLLSLVFV